MPTNFYDVVVLGDELSGLIAGALCARRGLRVLLTHARSTPDSYTIGSFTFPRAPLPFPCESSPSVRRVVAELNLIQTLKRRIVPVRPSFQAILPDARLDVGPDGELLTLELDRELAKERGVLEEFFARAAEVSRVLEPVLGQNIAVPPTGFWERRELKYTEARLPQDGTDPLPGIPEGHPARAFLALPAAFTLALDPRYLTFTAMARAFDLWRRGGAIVDGGVGTLRQLLREKLSSKHGGEVRITHPKGLVTRWGRVQGLVLDGPDGSVGTSSLLAALSLAELGDLFGDKWPKALMQAARAMKPTAYRYVLHLVLDASALPEGMARTALAVFEPNKPLIGDNALAILVGEVDDQARVLVTVLANAPAPADGQTLDDVLADIRPRIRARLEEFMPFYSDHVLCAHSPNQSRPPEGMRIKDLPPMMAPEPLWSSSLPSVLGVGAAPHDLGLRCLSTACAQNLPGLGIEGEFFAGTSAARFACAAAGKKKDYLKDEVLLGT